MENKSATLTVERLPLAKLKPHPANPRRHPEPGTPAWNLMKKSLEHDYFDPIVWNKRNGLLVSGHLRRKVLEASGFTEADCVVVDYDDSTHLARLLSANKAQGEDDIALMKDLIIDLDSLTENFDMDLSGFTKDELERVINSFGDHPIDAEPQTDRAAELQKQWGTATGQLWELGEHRLLCGDSTKRGDVERLLDGAVPMLMVTDPPYGVRYEGGTVNETKREKLEGDDSTDLFAPALALAAERMPTGAWYVWHADRRAMPVYAAISAAGYDVRALLIWNKLKAHYGAPSAHYCQKHEPCLYAVRGNADFTGASNECTVWDIEQPSRNEHHPTQKPLECMARAVGNHGSRGAIVFDPFLGSGTTLIAAEGLGRKCYGLEISPGYCAVILQRFKDATGKTPTLINA